MLAHPVPLTQLRRRWLIVASAYGVALILGYSALAMRWQPTYAQRWTLWAMAALVIQLAILWWGLKHNHRRGEAHLLPTLGYGNGLTLTRGLAICLLAGFLFSPRPPGLLAWVPALLYTLSSIIDYLDGYVARVTGHSTVLGEILDMEFDGLGMLVAIAVAIQYGQLPWWYLILGLGRQLFIGGIWLRNRLNKPVYEMTPSENRRLIAGFQMGFMTVILWPIFSPPTTTLACVLFSIPLAGSFIRDWLVVSGVLRPESDSYQRGRRVIKQVMENWLPLGLRLMGAGVAVALLVAAWPTFATWRAYLQVAEPFLFRWLLIALSVLSPLAIVFYLLGILGRLMAVVLVGLAFLDLLANGFNLATNGLLLTCTLWVAQFGSGAFALWTAEEPLLRRRAGE